MEKINLKNTRLYYLDNLKWFLTILVICFHSAGTIRNKVFNDLYYIQDKTLILYGFFNQSFFMSLFFAISSFFIIPSLKRKGSKKFFIDRLTRLSIPILITFLIITPIINYLTYKFFRNETSFYTSYLHNNLNFANLFINNTYLGVVWFLKSLLIFTIILLLYWLFKKPRLEQNKKCLTHTNVAIFLAIIIPINFIVQFFLPKEFEKFMYIFSITGKKDVVLYVEFFILGIKCWQNQWLSSINIKFAMPWFILALICFEIISFSMFNYHNEYEADRLYLILKPINCVGITLMLLSIFQSYFNITNKFTKFMSLYAYGAYIFQMFFVCILST